MNRQGWISQYLLCQIPQFYRNGFPDIVRSCASSAKGWGLYRDRSRIQIKLLIGARWGREHLAEALDRAESDRQWVRQALINHSKGHEQAAALVEDRRQGIPSELPMVLRGF